MGCHDGELSILFIDDPKIAELNRKYLGRDGPTNVLAFPMADSPVGASAVAAYPAGREPVPGVETGMLGDVVISVDRAEDESKESGESLEKAIDRLLIHGILHLLDYDHEGSPQEAERMEREQKRLLSLMEEE